MWDSGVPPFRWGALPPRGDAVPHVSPRPDHLDPLLGAAHFAGISFRASPVSLQAVTLWAHLTGR